MIGSLFSGIGGIEMGLELCGLGPVLWQCDNDPHARAVLATHWPSVRRYNDVREIDETAERPEIICGGFPCQDISLAGKGAGIDGARSGLWSEYARIIRALRPSVVFVENVAALVNRGIDRVLGDLAALGFDAEWDVFRASDVGAPHRRERLFLLAYAGCTRLEGEKHQEPFVAERGRWLPEPDVGRVASRSPLAAHRLRLLGNSVVPQQAALAWRTLTARIAQARAA